MRILKLVLVVLFTVSAAVPFLSMKLTVLGVGSKPPASAGKGQQKAPLSADPSLYAATESCEECHTNQAAHYALTAHSKTKVGGKGAVDMVGCQACQIGRAHV